MKKYILLLIIPFMFLSSCKEEENSVCPDSAEIQCGELIDVL